MKTLENYIPERIEPIIAKRYEELPKQLFTEAKSLDEIKKVIHKHFVTTNEKIVVQRKLDAAEVGTYRSNYPDLLEQVLPKLKKEQAEIIENAEAAIKDAKRAMQEAQDRVNACLTQMSDIAYIVNAGYKDMTLEQTQCYCFPVCGHYLYYAWVNAQFTLVRVQQIQSNEKGQLFTQGEQNTEAFLKHLNVNLVALLDERKAFAANDIEQQAYEEAAMSDIESRENATEE